MRTILIMAALTFVAACGAASTANRPHPAKLSQAQSISVAYGWTEKADAESKLIGAPCDLLLSGPAADMEICLKVGPTEAEPFMELPKEALDMIAQRFADDGWTDIAMLYDPARKLLGYGGTKVLELKKGAPPSKWRVRYLRADLPNEPGMAVMLLGVAPASRAHELDAAVDGLLGSLKPSAK